MPKTVKKTETSAAQETKEAKAVKEPKAPKAVKEPKTAKTTKTAKAPKATKAAKTVKEPKTTRTKAAAVKVYVEYQGVQVSQDDIIAAVKSSWTGEAIKTLEVYVKPEDGAAYYVVNGKEGGKVSF